MKKLLLTAAAALALVAATASTAQAQSSGYTCSYRFYGANYVTLSGSENMPRFCRAFSGGKPRAYWPSGRIACVFRSRLFDVRVTVRSQSAYMGPAMCSIIRRAGGGAFYRIR